MNRKARIEEIHNWWEGRPAERYWLGATERDDRDRLLASPCGDERAPESWTRRLIAHVRGGDVIFHYDVAQRGIVACSLAYGRVEKRQLPWQIPADDLDESVSWKSIPSLAITLRQSTELGSLVSLGEIAATQWSLFPALRALEDEVGDPLYYPFEMGSRETTRPLRGYVFKLPAIFVAGFPELARAASRWARVPAAHTGTAGPLTAAAGSPQAVSR